MSVNSVSGRPKCGYQYEIKMPIDAGVWEEIKKIIINSLAEFGYKTPRERFGPIIDGMHAVSYWRAYDRKDQALGVPEKYSDSPRFGQVYVTYYFADDKADIPCKISIEPGIGWETESDKYDRTFLTMEAVEKNLSSYIGLSFCTIIYKCLEGVEGFDVHVDLPL